MINSLCSQANAFAQRNELNTEWLKPHMMQRWTQNAKEMVKKAKEKSKNDIRRHCEELN